MNQVSQLFFRFPGFKTKAVTLSYDDGDLCDRDMISILDRYGIKGTFNLNAGRIADNPNKVQLEDLENTYRGHEIATHTFTHPYLHNLDLGGISYQLVHDRELLEDTLHRPIEGFAYPYGLREETNGMVDCLKYCGIRYARTTTATYNFGLPTDPLRWNPTCHHANARLPELMEKFLTPDNVENPHKIKPRLFFIWGHAREFIGKWEDLEQICKTIGNQEDVWYATNGEIMDYLTAYRSLRRSINGDYVYNPTDKDIYVMVHHQNILLEKGKITTLK